MADDDQTTQGLQEENERLRSDLAAQNESLREQLAASRAQNPDQGLTDEDVRRLERPAEFADEPAADEHHEKASTRTRT